METSAWGTAPIKCGKASCDWKGFETDLVMANTQLNELKRSACPKCSAKSYSFMTPTEIAEWRSKIPSA